MRRMRRRNVHFYEVSLPFLLQEGGEEAWGSELEGSELYVTRGV